MLTIPSMAYVPEITSALPSGTALPQQIMNNRAVDRRTLIVATRIENLSLTRGPDRIPPSSNAPKDAMGVQFPRFQSPENLGLLQCLYMPPS